MLLSRSRAVWSAALPPCCCSANRPLLPRLASSSTSSSRRAASTAATSTATIPSPITYAHEDLLSTTPDSRPRPPSSRRRTTPFFSRSFLAPEPLAPPSTSPLVPARTPIPKPLPPTLLASGLPNPAIRWRARPDASFRDDLALYKALAKARLSAFTVLTAMAGYAMCPVDPRSAHAAMDALAQSLAGSPISALPDLAPLAASNDLALSVLLPVTVGTALCAASAAAFNELVEAPYDAQMARTRGRPVPRRYLTPLHAAVFGTATGAVGLGTLAFVNPLAATVGLGTILLYCPLYTITKRYTVYNTWLGAVVGALPPLIGWAACTASLSPITEPGAWALFLLMFFWQFPHFNSLAHTLRSSYASSGYRMLPVLDPPRNARVAFRYALALLPLGFAFPVLGLTNAWFPWLVAVPNGAIAWAAYRFWRTRTDRRAKVLFWVSLVHLPAFLGLAMLTKTGLKWPWESSDQVELVSEGEEQ